MGRASPEKRAHHSYVLCVMCYVLCAMASPQKRAHHSYVLHSRSQPTAQPAAQDAAYDKDDQTLCQKNQINQLRMDVAPLMVARCKSATTKKPTHCCAARCDKTLCHKN